MVAFVEGFERVAETVAARMAELLGAQVFVVDKRDIVVAGSARGAIGLPFDLVKRAPGGTCLRVPIRLDARDGEVIVTDPVNGEVVSPRVARALVELIINQTAVVARLPNRDELKNTFIHDLLRDVAGDEADVLREAQILGMDFTRPRAVILIDAAAYILASNGTSRGGNAATTQSGESLMRRRAHLVIASVVSFFNLPSDTICAYIGDGEIAVLKASGTQDLAAWTEHEDALGQSSSSSWANLTLLKRASGALLARLRRDINAPISIGLGRYHPGIRGIARSYQDARAALSLGRRFHGDNGVHCLDGLGVAAFVGVSDEQTKIDLATHLLSPLDHERELLDTLEAFFAENCCPSSSARRLAIHRNTLAYRLDKVRLLTGLNPRRFDDATQIRLALLLRSLSHGD